MSDLYKILGVARNATKDQIKKAFRRKMKEAHPDREDGDHETAVALNRAYDTLGDDAKRKRYDETGDDGPAQEPTKEDKARQSLARAFDDMLSDEVDWLSHEDPLARLRRGMKEAMNAYQIEIKAVDSYLEKMKRKLTRVKLKNKTPESIDLWTAMAAEREKRYNQRKTQLSEMIEITKIAQQMLEDYEGEFTKPEPNDKPPSMHEQQQSMYSQFVDIKRGGLFDTWSKWR